MNRLLAVILPITVFLTLSLKAQTSSLSDLCLEQEWNTVYFPYRWGWDTSTNSRTKDFYTFQKFKEAIAEIGKIELLFERRCGTNQIKVTRTDTSTGVEKVISVSTDYNASWNVNKPIVKERILYKNFLSEGTLEARKRELAAFFSNISHETTGGPATNNNYKWGLYFLEEGENLSSPPNTYVSASVEYPAVSGQSYHGRGPIQLSYNYNYGLASEQILGDKDILLQDPAKVSSDAKLAFMTAIWFWMTPQAPKPSSHDVMVGNWTPSTSDIADKRTAGLGMTVNIINGGVECGDGGAEKYQVLDRINYYKRFASYLRISTDLDGSNTCNTCGCAAMKNYANDNIGSENCTNIPSIEISSPIDGSLIFDTGLNSISVNSQYESAGKQARQFEVTVEAESFNQTIFSWSPQFFKAYTLTASVLIDDIPYEAKSTITFYAESASIDCSAIKAFSNSTSHSGGSVVQLNGKIYKAKYWTDKSPQTDATAWETVGTCMGTNNAPSLHVTNNSSSTAFSFKTDVSDSDGGVFFVDFLVDGSLIERYNPRSTVTQNVSTTTHTFSFMPTQNKQYEIKIIVFDRSGVATEKSLQITGQALSVEEQELQRISVYPNPFYNKVQVVAPTHVGKTQMEIFDFQGRKVAAYVFDFSHKNIFSFSLPQNASTVYFMRLWSDANVKTVKLIRSQKNKP